ncbi:Membrane protein involved in the export of O-antigen and teichoic acid [Ruminococcaceae bacterium YRB3002]|nr:Membrane protein involved in the export of O-antigen and teichoic acid [Ruminococcaceae bacterium YRB3002]
MSTNQTNINRTSTNQTSTRVARPTLINMVTGLLLQVCLTVSGLILPRLIIGAFGSETNGLVASINQLLNYITLVEGGLTAVVTASLYKPLVENDARQLSRVICTTRQFYVKIGIVFAAYAGVVAVVYPVAKKLELGYTAALVVILAVTNLVHYVFALTSQVLLNADKRQYVIYITQMVIIVAGTVLAAVSVRIYPSIHLMLGIVAAMYVVQPVVLGLYVRRHYAIDRRAERDSKLLKERWNGFAINVAAFVHNNTDIVVLTIFRDLKTVSVYSVYALVTIGARSVILSLANGLTPVIGQAYARGDTRDLERKMDVYEYIVLALVGFMLTVSALLITPFVMLYTSGISDADYCQPVFGYLIVAGEAVYLLKKPHVDLAFAADRFRETRLPAYIETLLNIVVSIVLVTRFGLIGVAIGTLVAMLWRLAFHVDLAGRIIKGRGSARYLIKLFFFSLTSAAGFAICRLLMPIADSGVTVTDWLVHAVLYCAVFAVLYLVLSLVLFRREVRTILRYLTRKPQHRENAPAPEIDLVYLYVNPEDPAWEEERRAQLRAAGLEEDNADNNCRFRENHEIYYSLRSVARYAPWINHIYIVTNSEMPDWLDLSDSKITIVKHEEIMPQELLPCYNCTVIETWLWKIPGLSEVFIYGNDDTFFGSEVTPDFFFRDGKPVVRMLKADFDTGRTYQGFRQIMVNSMNVFGTHYSKRYNLVKWHNFDVYTKSAMEACFNEFEAEFAHRRSHRFRTSEDIDRVIFQYYMIANGLCHLNVYDHSNFFARAWSYLKIMIDPETYFDFACWGMHDFSRSNLMKRLLLKGPRCVCINDEETATLTDRLDYRVWMEELFGCERQSVEKHAMKSSKNTQ